MGFEYRVVTELNRSQKKAVQDLLEGHGFRKNSNEGDDEIAYELRTPEQTDSMPQSMVSVDTHGIYICQNLINNPWADLDDVKKYFEANQLHFAIEEI